MTRRWQLITALVAAFGLVASLVALPLEPFDAEIMAALSDTGATLEDRPLQDFTLFTTSGEAVTSASLAGRPVYLTFWAEWCDVCKSEMPSLDAFAQSHSGQVDVLCVAVDQDPAPAYQWLRQNFPNGTNFRVLRDPGAQVANGLFGTTGVPETFILDPDGYLVARYVGPANFGSPAHAQLVARLQRR